MLNRLHGKWALVTGASAGIGQEFCRQLAAAGMNLFLVARREPLLQELAKSLETSHGIACRPLAMDLAAPDSADQLLAEVQAQDIEIALLVNNAGVGQWGRFQENARVPLEVSIKVNVTAPMMLCHAFFDQLVTHAPDAAVINISSQAALQPVPYMAVYAASKTFLHNFSLALYEEWKDQGIHVQTLIPGPTQSEFDEKAGAYESKVQKRDPPEKAVLASLEGLAHRRPVVASAKGTFTQRMFNGLFPPRMVTREVAKMFRPPNEED